MIPVVSPVMGEEEIKRVSEVLLSGMIVQGSRVAEFERKFSGFVGAKHGVAVFNGTAALDIALKAAGIGEGDEVITTPFTFIATSNAILFQRAKPVFADIEMDTYNIDPDSILEKITPRTRAIVGVHLFGHPFDVKPVLEICDDYGLTLIEDSAQAHGAEYRGQRVGSFGIGCFSFYATKNMTTSEGGMITCNDREIAERCRLLRSHGEARKYEHVVLGHNMRMTDIQAALGLAQLEKLEWMNERRRENARFYERNIKVEGLKKPVEKEYGKHVYHQYTLLLEDEFPMSREEFSGYLSQNGVGNAVHYPKPVYLQPLYRELGYGQGLCPVAEYVSERIISIPVHPLLSQEDLEQVSNAVSSVAL